MDVSIAVSLIRGQMGSVVERAVNGAVETVLAEMLKVVGVKFEELKTQLALMKRDVTALQREKALKEKDNDNIRAKLRYTELKLKYYRQGVEEELQQRASASTLVRIHPSSFPQTQTDAAGLSSTDTSPSCSTQNRTTEGALMRCNQESTSPHSTSRRAFRVHCQSDAGGASSHPSDLLLPVSLSENTPTESLDSSTEQEAVESVNDFLAPPTVQTVTLALGKKSATRRLCPHGSIQAVSSTLPFSAPQSWSSPVVMQLKQEAQQQGEEEGVICIKEEPEEEQQVMATLGLEYQVQQRLSGSEGQSSVTELQPSQATKTTAFSSAGTSNYLMLQPIGSLPSMVTLPSGIPPLQEGRPWSKNLSFYEQYKLRRNELQQRRLNRRREQEETLPQPLLADMLRERREKTRLRVARWRAKRKLQFCLNQTQGQGGAAGLSQPFVPIRSKHQEGRESCASSSGHHRLSSTLPQSSSFLDNNMSVTNTITTALPFITSISSSSLLPGSSIMAAHQHTVTSTSSSFSYPQISQSFSLTDADILQ